jgi:Ca2+-binding RTX toxin-like protein
MGKIRGLLFLAAAAALLLTNGSALAAFIRCQTGVVCNGTEQADDLVGTSRNNIMNGLGGNDILTLNGGDDEAYGGAGNDKLFGEGGHDRVMSGGDGHDLIEGHTGRDGLIGGTGDDVLDAVRFEEGFPERDTISCGAGFDTVKADRADVFLDRASCERVTIV